MQNGQKHPVGVLILIIYAFLFTGILPLSYPVLLLSSGIGSVLNHIVAILFAVSGLGTIITAIYTWRGKKGALRILWILIALHFFILGSVYLIGMMTHPWSD